MEDLNAQHMELVAQQWRWRVALRKARLPASGYQVGLALIDEFLNRKNGALFPSYKAIAEACEIPVETVRTRDANLWREGGQLYAHVMVPRGTGSRAARVFASQLVDLFRGEDIGTLTFREASIGAGEAGDVDGSYYRLTATIDWQRDI